MNSIIYIHLYAITIVVTTIANNTSIKLIKNFKKFKDLNFKDKIGFLITIYITLFLDILIIGNFIRLSIY